MGDLSKKMGEIPLPRINPDLMRCDQKVLCRISFGEIHGIKIFVSRSSDLIEGHWGCEKHAAMLGCLCKALLRVEGETHLQIEKLEIRVVIKYFCKKGMPSKGSS